MQISQDLNRRLLRRSGSIPTDTFFPKESKVLSPWRINNCDVCTVMKKWKDAWATRLASLYKAVQYWKENKSDKFIEVVELFLLRIE